MKSRRNNFIILLITSVMAGMLSLQAQDNARKTLSINLQYYCFENTTMYVMATVKAKVNGRFRPIKEVMVKFYLNEESPTGFMDNMYTDENGMAKAFLPVGLKSLWQETDNPVFWAISNQTDSIEHAEAELTITKSRLIIDTLTEDGTRSIKVTAQALVEKSWKPIKDLEVKIGVSRHGGGMLKVSEEESYTTDSTGALLASFTDTLLAGDPKGILALEAKVDENETYGNLQVTQPAYWGIPTSAQEGFFDLRTLWTTRFRTPYWLLFIVYGMSLGIWGTIFIVFRSLIKIVKLGSET